MTKGMLAVGIVRVSTTEQEISPEAQRAEIEAWCHANGYTLVAVHADIGVSGGVPLEDRPGLMAAIADIRTYKASVLIATKRDRLARDVLLAAMVERLVQREGAVVRTVQGAGNGDGPEDQLLRTMLDAFSQYERALIRSRVRSALRHKRNQGESIGPAPYGWQRVPSGRMRRDGSPIMVLEPYETEREALRLAYWLHHVEGWKADATGRMLVRKGYRPRSGADSWNPKTIREFLAAASELCHEQAGSCQEGTDGTHRHERRGPRSNQSGRQGHARAKEGAARGRKQGHRAAANRRRTRHGDETVAGGASDSQVALVSCKGRWLDLFLRKDGSIRLAESKTQREWYRSEAAEGEVMLASHCGVKPSGPLRWDWEDWSNSPTLPRVNQLLILAALGLADD